MTGLLRRKHSIAIDDARGVTVRPARPTDADAIAHLAHLDSSRAPSGDVLVAEVGGELWAALSLDDFHAIADPFRPSGELVFLLAEHARRREAQGRREHGRRRRWRALPST